jgi:hypothetical protein
VQSPEPPAQTRQDGQVADAPQRGLLPSLSGRMGCDDRPGSRPTEAQRQACYDNAARLAQNARQLDLNISAQNKAAYDHYVMCMTWLRQPIPAYSNNNGMGDDATMTMKCPFKDR